MKNYLVDSDIIIDCLRQEKSVLEFLKTYIEHEDALFMIASITRAELFSGRSAQDIKGERFLSKVLDSFVEIPLDKIISETAGKFRFKYSISLADAIIAATAYHNADILLTRNFKDFGKIKEIKIGNI